MELSLKDKEALAKLLQGGDELYPVLDKLNEFCEHERLEATDDALIALNKSEHEEAIRKAAVAEAFEQFFVNLEQFLK